MLKSHVSRGFALIGLLALAMVVVEALPSPEPALAQVKQGKTRLLKTKQLMQGLHKLHCGALGKGLEKEPADKKAWEGLAVNAAMLNEASYILMADGRCPDAEWAKAAKALGESSAEVLEKIDAEDYPGAKEAFGVLTKSCGACHKVHKK